MLDFQCSACGLQLVPVDQNKMGELKKHMKAKHAIIYNVDSFVSLAMGLVCQIPDVKPENLVESSNGTTDKEQQQTSNSEKNWEQLQRAEMNKIQEMLLGEQDVSDEENSEEENTVEEKICEENTFEKRICKASSSGRKSADSDISDKIQEMLLGEQDLSDEENAEEENIERRNNGTKEVSSSGKKGSGSNISDMFEEPVSLVSADPSEKEKAVKDNTVKPKSFDSEKKKDNRYKKVNRNERPDESEKDDRSVISDENVRNEDSNRESQTENAIDFTTRVKMALSVDSSFTAKKVRVNLKPVDISMYENSVKQGLLKDVTSLGINATNKRRHKCETCPKSFSERIFLRRHSLRAHKKRLKNTPEEEKRFTCQLCYKKFDLKVEIERHKRVMHKDDGHFFGKVISEDDLQFRCKICESRFVSHNSLRLHSRRVHKKEIQKRSSCKLCYKEFSDKRNLPKHEKKIHKDDAHFLSKTITQQDLIFSCQSCELKFVSNATLSIHTKYKHTTSVALENVTDRYECEECKRVFVAHRHLRKHAMKAHNKVIETNLAERRFACPMCDKKFDFKCLVDKHALVVHSEEKKFSCKLCYKESNYEAEIKKHKIKVHTEDAQFLQKEIAEEDLKFACASCDKKFVSETSREYHSRFLCKQRPKANVGLKLRKSRDNMFSCQLCYRKFRLKGNIGPHQKRVHSQDLHFLEGDFPKEFSCTDCEKCFVSLNTLGYHQRTSHSGQVVKKKSYCKLCYVTFKRAAYFAVHVKKWHKTRNELNALNGKIDKENWTVSCSLCELKFLTENILNRHMKYGHRQESVSEKSCKLCFITYKRQADYDRHVESVHSSEQETYALMGDDIDKDLLTYGCDHCEKKFLTENILNFHVRYYHQNRKRQNVSSNNAQKKKEMNCKLCYVNFKYLSQLERHKKAVHKGELRGFELDLSEQELAFSCEKCDKKFWSRTSLSHHKEVNHPRFKSAKKSKSITEAAAKRNSVMPRQENLSYMFEYI